MASPSCPHCDQPDATLLRLVLIGAWLVADDTQLLRLAAVLRQCGFCQLSPEPHPDLVQTRQATLQYLQWSGPQGEQHEGRAGVLTPAARATFLCIPHVALSLP